MVFYHFYERSKLILIRAGGFIIGDYLSHAALYLSQKYGSFFNGRILSSADFHQRKVYNHLTYKLI